MFNKLADACIKHSHNVKDIPKDLLTNYHQE